MQALVATDVAARGIHVDGVASVVHFDPPEDHKAYIHRSGRTARAGETGTVVSLVLPEHTKAVEQIQRDLDIDQPITKPDPLALRNGHPTPALAEDAPQPTRKPKSNSRPKSPAKNRAQKPGDAPKGRAQKPSNAPKGRAQKSRNAPKGRAQKPSNGPKGGARKPSNSKGRKKPKNRAPAGTNSSGRPNRKARRAHLQPGASRT